MCASVSGDAGALRNHDPFSGRACGARFSRSSALAVTERAPQAGPLNGMRIGRHSNVPCRMIDATVK
jgi:hypothetical protein